MIFVKNMKFFLIFYTAFSFGLHSFGQKTETSTDYYFNGQLHWKGEMLQIGNYSHPIGLWQYWHEDGKLKLETWDHGKRGNDFVKTRYINMWTSTGEQILKDGEGFMYEVWPGGDQEADSTIYQVKDSIKQGYSKVYRLYRGGEYFLVMEGNYDSNSLKTGKWVFRDTVLGNAFEWYYENDKKNGLEKWFYPDGGLREIGQYKNDEEEGEWRYYDSGGPMIKICNYKTGKLIGPYKEYYPNGKIKVEGAYRQGEGTIKVSSRPIGGGKGRVYDRKIPNKEYKTGKWVYYNSKGAIIKTENYP